MKILYVGHYKESSGWSQAAIDYILALDSVGVDVVCKNIKLTNKSYDIPTRILELESKDLNNIDYCIQHVLPHHLVATDKFKKNIAYFAGETNTIKHLSWFENLCNMDEVWVPNEQYQNVLIANGIKTVKTIPHTFDMSKYSLQYKTIHFNEYNSCFKFYTISDLDDRKNIDSILRSYYSEFNSDDNVLLVLKIKKYSLSEEDLNTYIKNKIQNIKKELRMYKDLSKYAPEIIISSNISNADIMSLHQSCDCFVGISHGEAWSIPAFDAMCFGKTPICSNNGGPADFIDKNNISTGKLIDGTYDVCSHKDPAFMELFSGREEWFHPSEQLTKRAMREIYSNQQNINKKAGLIRGTNYSYENIGKLMKDCLND